MFETKEEIKTFLVKRNAELGRRGLKIINDELYLKTQRVGIKMFFIMVSILLIILSFLIGFAFGALGGG